MRKGEKYDPEVNGLEAYYARQARIAENLRDFVAFANEPAEDAVAASPNTQACIGQISKCLYEAPGRVLTQNEIYDWWKASGGEPGVLREALRHMLETKLAYGKNTNGLKLLCADPPETKPEARPEPAKSKSEPKAKAEKVTAEPKAETEESVDDLPTTVDVARQLEVTTACVRQWATRGILVAAKAVNVGETQRYTRQSVAALLKAYENGRPKKGVLAELARANGVPKQVFGKASRTGGQHELRQPDVSGQPQQEQAEAQVERVAREAMAQEGQQSDSPSRGEARPGERANEGSVLLLGRLTPETRRLLEEHKRTLLQERARIDASLAATELLLAAVA